MAKIEKTLEFLWNELIYGGHLLSLGAVSVVYVSAALLNIEITWDHIVVVYFGAHVIFLYNFFKELKQDTITNFQRVQHLKKYIQYIPYIIICYFLIFIVFLLLFHKIPSLFFGLLLIILGILYTLFFKKFTEKIIAFKNFFVALVWLLLVIFFIIYYSFPLNFSVTLVLIFIYIRSFIHTSFFDVKDIESDKKEHLLTMPILLDEKKVFFILIIFNILSAIPIVYGFYFNLFPSFSLMLLLTVPYTFWFFKKIRYKKENIAYLSYFFTAGEKILWIILILLGKFLL